MQCSVGSEKLRRAARVPLESKARRFEKIRRANVLAHFVVLAGARTEKCVAETARRFEDRGVGGESLACQQRGFSAVARRIAGVKRLYHRALLAMNTATAGSRDAEDCFDLVYVQSQ